MCRTARLRNTAWPLVVAAVAMSAYSTAGSASKVDLKIGGSGISGLVTLTYSLNPNTGPLGTSPNANDPVGSYVITGASGSFSDSNAGLSNVPITGVVPASPSAPKPTNLLAPHSFGFYPVGSGLPSPQGIAPGLSYDDLFYPGGSPQTATDYPFHGGLLDIYGVIFTLLGGDAVDVWSAGDMGKGVTYGAAVTDGQKLLDRQGGLSVSAVPEPSTWMLLMLGFACVGLVARYRRTKLQHA